jgi:hypothetical protein
MDSDPAGSCPRWSPDIYADDLCGNVRLYSVYHMIRPPAITCPFDLVVEVSGRLCVRKYPTSVKMSRSPLSNSLMIVDRWMQPFSDTAVVDNWIWGSPPCYRHHYHHTGGMYVLRVFNGNDTDGMGGVFSYI